ncbi:MAG: DUF4465 domain-containing protein [Bacteroidales bacterium]|nr:DUF4465 domain-containing protein [Bacteroidales bacterium]
MKILKYTLGLVLAGFLAVSCEDQVHDSKLAFPNDVTFNEEENSLDIQVPELDFVQLDAPFTARAYEYGTITMNAKKKADGTHVGFALSNKNYRSYPWCNSKPHGSDNVPASVLKEATDTLLYSCYSGSYPNQLKNFAVARVEGEEAYFTIDKPRQVEHVLISHCTFNFLALSYGSVYSSNLDSKTQVYLEEKDGKLATVRNPNIPDNASSKYGVWYLPDYYDFGEGEPFVRMLSNPNKAKAYVKLIATGYNGGTKTGTAEFYVAVRTGVAPAPYDKWNMVQGGWAPWDLKALGTVDKVVFTIDSSEKIAPYFCIDGIRLK